MPSPGLEHQVIHRELQSLLNQGLFNTFAKDLTALSLF